MYSETQKNLAAVYLARAGMNVALAVSELRKQEESFRKIGENTLRGWLVEEAFTKNVQDHTTAIREAQMDAAAARERVEFQKRLAGSTLDELQNLETEGWEMLKRLKEKFDVPDADKHELLKFWKELQSFAMGLRAKHGSILTESWQSGLIVKIFIAEVQGEYGVDAAKILVKRVNESYAKSVIEYKAQQASAQGESAHATAKAPVS